MRSAPYSAPVERESAVSRVSCRDREDRSTADARNLRRWRRKREREGVFMGSRATKEAHSGASRRLRRNDRPEGCCDRDGRKVKQKSEWALGGACGKETLGRCMEAGETDRMFENTAKVRFYRHTIWTTVEDPSNEVFPLSMADLNAFMFTSLC